MIRTVLIKIILLFNIDIMISRLLHLMQLAEIRRIEKKCGCSIKIVSQGFNGVRISSSTGDFSSFFIDPTSHIKSDSFIECSGGVHIGRYFHTGRCLTIFSVDHNYRYADKIPYDGNDIYLPVIVKDFVWCGANVTILKGVTIGEGAIVAANSVISKNVPDYAIVAGNPAVVIGYRDSKRFRDLKKRNMHY